VFHEKEKIMLIISSFFLLSKKYSSFEKAQKKDFLSFLFFYRKENI